MTDSPPSPLPLVIAELTFAGLTGHVTQLLSLLPGWAGGILGGLVVLLVSRLFGPTLDVHGERIKRRLTPPPSVPPPPPRAPDDTDASG